MKKKKVTPGTILANLDAIVTSATLFGCVLLVNANIIMRYFFNAPIHWAEEITTSMFVWTVFIGSAYAYRKKEHLGVDIIIKHLPKNISSKLKVVIAILELLILIMLTVISAQYVYHIMFSRSGAWKPALTDLLRIPKWYTGIAVPLGFGLSTIHSVRFLIQKIRGTDEEEGGESDDLGVY